MCASREEKAAYDVRAKFLGKTQYDDTRLRHQELVCGRTIWHYGGFLVCFIEKLQRYGSILNTAKEVSTGMRMHCQMRSM